jgi:hypothetical protein
MIWCDANNQLLPCKQTRCDWHLAYINCPQTHRAERFRTKKRTSVSKIAPISLLPSTTLLGRLMASIDRLLIASSRIAVRNGDLPRFGL